MTKPRTVPVAKKITKTTEDIHVKILKGKSSYFYAGKDSCGLISFGAVRIS